VDERTEHAHFKLELHFERGLVSLGGEAAARRAVPSNDVTEPWWQRLADDTLPAPAWPGTPILNAVQDLVRCVQSGAEPRCTGADGRAALEVIMAFYESERRGHGKVALPLHEPRPMLEVMKQEGRY
jgi:predicted dehydrogenase